MAKNSASAFNSAPSAGDFLLALTEPYFLDRLLSLGGELFYHDATFISNVYNQRNYGLALTLRKPLTPFLSVSLGYRLEDVDIYDVPISASPAIKSQQGSQTISEITSSLVWDTRDNPFISRTGHRVVFTPYIAGGFLGADTQIYGWDIEGSQYFKLWYDTILLFNAEAAVVEAWGSHRDFQVPIYNRLFLGGGNDLRGFDFREVGPKDINGEPIGGQTIARFTVEYTIPIIEKIRVAFFYDTGFNNIDPYNFGISHLASDIGFGVRLNLPIGPLRIDYGIPILKDNNSGFRAFQLQRRLPILNEPHLGRSNAFPTTCFMKKLLSLALLSAFALPGAALAQLSMKVGTVDMNRAFKEYNKTKDAEGKINDAKNSAKKEYDDRAESYKKALDEINKMNQQLDAPALSADAKTKMAKDRDEKISNIKTMEREINEFRQTRERQLQEQALRMREGIVKEITDIVMDKVKANNLDLVFDKSGMSLNGVPIIMFSRDNVDFTNDIITVLNKPGRVTTTAPATSPSTATSPASRPAASASPASKP